MHICDSIPVKCSINATNYDNSWPVSLCICASLWVSLLFSSVNAHKAVLSAVIQIHQIYKLFDMTRCTPPSPLYNTQLCIKPHAQQAYGKHRQSPDHILFSNELYIQKSAYGTSSCHDPQIKFYQLHQRSVSSARSVRPKNSIVELMWLNVIPASLPEPKLF